MGNLVENSGDRLNLAHALPDGNALTVQGEETVRVITDGLEVDGYGRGSPESFQKALVILHIAGKVGGELRQRLSIRLGHIKDGHGLIHGDFDFLFLHDDLAILVQHGQLGIRVQLLLFDCLFEGGGGDDFDALFALSHMALKLVPPLVEARHKGGVGPLHIDEHLIVYAVAVKPAHRFQILGVFVRLKEILNASFDAVCDVFEPCFGILLLVFSHRRTPSMKISSLKPKSKTAM